jgi:transcription antitermination factor NusG
MDLKEYKIKLEEKMETKRNKPLTQFLSLMLAMNIDLYSLDYIRIRRVRKLRHVVGMAYSMSTPVDWSDLEIEIIKGGASRRVNAEYKIKNELARILRNEETMERLKEEGIEIDYECVCKKILRKEKWVLNCKNIKNEYNRI